MKKPYWVLLIFLVITITTTAIVIVTKHKPIIKGGKPIIKDGYVCVSNNCSTTKYLIFEDKLLTIITTNIYRCLYYLLYGDNNLAKQHNFTYEQQSAL